MNNLTKPNLKKSAFFEIQAEYEMFRREITFLEI